MSNADLIEQTASLLVTVAYAHQEFDNYDHVLHHGNVKKLTEALEAADKRIAEQAEEITMLRYRHLITCGTTHPEMYKTELDHAKERIAELERKLDVAREALLYISQVACSLSPEQKVSNEALAQIGGEEK